MERDIISKVVGVEKEIQDRLDLEKRRADEWLKKVKEEAEEEIRGEGKTLKESFTKAKKDEIAATRRKAAEILNDAAIEAERLSKISDETLKDIIIRHISRILP
jgi:hypothetical protein